jgi:hypothetical protein
LEYGITKRLYTYIIYNAAKKETRQEETRQKEETRQEETRNKTEDGNTSSLPKR